MDLPVVLIKLRDYILWFGPAYLLAVGLGSALEVVVRRLLSLPHRRVDQTGKEPDGTSALHAMDANLLLQIWWHAAGRPLPAWKLPAQVYLWLALTTHSLSWTSLFMTAALSWPLSALRLGVALIMASLLSLLLPVFASLKPLILRPGPPELSDIPVRSTRLLAQWWHTARLGFWAGSNSLLLGAASGAALIALAPNLFASLDAGLTSPLAYLVGAIVGLVAPLPPGTDAPLIAAMQTRGVEAGATMAFMLASSASTFGLLRQIREAFGLKAVVVYIILAWGLTVAIAWLVSPALRAAGAI